jgi:hypothetical protein
LARLVSSEHSLKTMAEVHDKKTSALGGAARWKKRPKGSTWGDFGPEDQLGRLNLLTRERLLGALSEAHFGRSFCLSMPLNYPGGMALNPYRHPPRFTPLTRNGRSLMNYDLSLENPRYTDVLCDDQVALCLQYSTQWDSLAHFGSLFDANDDGIEEIVFYNGYRGGTEILSADLDHETSCGGAKFLGIENMAQSCVQGRGVMIDLEAHFGRERYAVSYQDLQSILEKDQVSVQEGDLVCFHSGYAQVLLDMGGNPDPAVMRSTGAMLDGRDEDLLQWVTDTGAVALISDTNAVELVPSRPGSGDRYSSLPLHEHCLFRLGVHLGEYWYLTELARWLRAHKRSRFLLTAPPLRLSGAVGSPVTPIATV